MGTARRRQLAMYLGCAAISLVAATLLLKLWTANLRVPFDYGGDSLQYEYIIKSVVEHGWYLTNADIGAPYGLRLYDYPVAANDTIHLLVIKAMSLFCGDWALLLNLYFLLGFPLIGVSARAVFRYYRVACGPAVVGAVLYSFLPSRLLKGEAHLFLDAFYVVPLSVLVVLWVCSDDPPWTRDGVGGGAPRIDLRRRRSLAALAICVLGGSTSLYYSFFAACLLLVGGLVASLERRCARNALSGLLLAMALGATVVANGLPTLIDQARHGANLEAAPRKPREAEIYGMKVAQLLLPVEGHRLRPLARLRQRYDAGAPLQGENATTSLGLVGSVGFLFLLGLLLVRARESQRGETPPERQTPREAPRGEILGSLAVLNVVAVLLGTIGGFGSLVALLVTPQIRTYSRIHVIIGSLAIFAAVLLLERLVRRFPRAGTAALPLVLLLGLLDQATPLAVRPYAAVGRQFASDAEFVRRIEATLAPESIVFVHECISRQGLCVPSHGGIARRSPQLVRVFVRAILAEVHEGRVADEAQAAIVGYFDDADRGIAREWRCGTRLECCRADDATPTPPARAR